MTILAAIMRLLGCHEPKAPDSVDVEAMLDKRAEAYHARGGINLDWRHSLEDMMKALDMGHDAEARRELAAELGCPYAPGSADANEWTRRELMRRVQLNGGKVPDELL